MKIKTYLVRSLSDAVEKIKKEMGPEAVILSTKKVTAETHPLAASTARLEVTAALYPVETHEYIPATTKPQAAAFQETNISGKAAAEKIPALEVLEASVAAAVTSSVTHSPVEDYLAKQNQKKIEEMEESILSVCKKLNDNEVQASIINELSEQLLSEPEGFNLERCEELSAQYLMSKMPKPKAFKREGYLAFVGPTGSGKTTSLMKLALKFKLEGCESLAIVSIDYDTLHRQEPLKRFAEKNKIPFFLVNHESQLTQNLSKFATYEVILFDTEGCSPYDNERMMRLAKTCESLAPLQTALVLPTHLAFGNLFSILKRFSVTHCDRLILTKLDETENFGNLLHASYYSQLPLAYLTKGQRVPEDIEQATLERVMDCLFRFSEKTAEVGAAEEIEVEFELEDSTMEETLPAEQIPVTVRSIPEGLTFV